MIRGGQRRRTDRRCIPRLATTWPQGQWLTRCPDGPQSGSGEHRVSGASIWGGVELAASSRPQWLKRSSDGSQYPSHLPPRSWGLAAARVCNRHPGERLHRDGQFVFPGESTEAKNGPFPIAMGSFLCPVPRHVHTRTRISNRADV